MMAPASVLQAYLDNAIPQATAMQVHVEDAGASGVVLRAPLAPNVNHEYTAFGGSIAALATLACWGWLWTRLHVPDTPVRIVVSRGETDYLAPLASDLTARCEAPPRPALEAFDRAYGRRGRARLEIEAVVEDTHGKVCARFNGLFVVMADK